MTAQLKRTWVIGACWLLFTAAGCRTERTPPPVNDAAVGDASLISDTAVMSDAGGGAGQMGSGGQAGSPGAGGSGGVAAGGAGGSNGAGGSTVPDGGGRGGSGADAAVDHPTDGPRDTKPDAGVGHDVIACGPVCAIFCPNGNVLDERGCPTCNCNPAKCAASECGPAPRPLPMMCPDGSTSGSQTCERNSDGRCRWVTHQCPAVNACAGSKDPATCNLRPACRWLAPGCTGPKLAEAGCYERADIGCVEGQCAAGKTCTRQVINPCPLAAAAAAIPAVGDLIPPPGGCTACGQQITLCM